MVNGEWTRLDGMSYATAWLIRYRKESLYDNRKPKAKFEVPFGFAVTMFLSRDGKS
jgi:hypothetical protein